MFIIFYIIAIQAPDVLSRQGADTACRPTEKFSGPAEELLGEPLFIAKTHDALTGQLYPRPPFTLCDERMMASRETSTLCVLPVD